MTTWNYKNISTGLELPVRAKLEGPYARPVCPFCPKTYLSELKGPELPGSWKTYVEDLSKHSGDAWLITWICKRCGWWYISIYHEWDDIGSVTADEMYGAGSCILTLDTPKLNSALYETRHQLANDFENTKKVVDPYRFEDVVTSVFRDLGYCSHATGYTNDGGIDIILLGPEDRFIGVQVKRYKNNISVSQIRELLGALFLKKLSDGIFVTTSDFQPGAIKAAKLANKLGYSLELINGDEFLQSLKFVERTGPLTREELLNFVQPRELKIIYSCDHNSRAPSSLHFLESKL